MLHITIKNQNSATALEIRDFLLTFMNKEEIDFKIYETLTFIDTQSEKVGSMILKKLDPKTYEEYTALHLFERGTRGNTLDINISLIDCYWGL